MKQTERIATRAPAGLLLDPGLFRPIQREKAAAEQISRPVLTYFQDAMLRFRKNKMGMAALATIVVMALAGVVGPWFFPASKGGISYENQQNLNAVSQDPTLGKQLLVLSDEWNAPDPLVRENFNTQIPLLPKDALQPPTNLSVAGTPSVNGVTLRWEPQEGVSGYQIFRTIKDKDHQNVDALGEDESVRSLALTKIEDPAQYSYTDSAGLDTSESYIYTLVSYVKDAESGEDVVSKKASVIGVSLTETLPLAQAQSIKSDAKVGETVRGRIFPFGTDSLGRDTFARMIQGIRVDFTLALIVPALCILLGVVYGATAGLAGGKVDLLMMRIIEILSTLPSMLLMIILQVVLGKGMSSLLITMVVFGWMSTARVIRGEVLRLREIEFVHASRLLGAPTGRLIRKHLAPNLIGYLLVDWSSRIPGVIVTEAFLSQFGLGLEQPTASWGMVLEDAGKRFQSFPIQFFLPAALMAIALLAFYLLGDALTEALDPKLRGRDCTEE